MSPGLLYERPQSDHLDRQPFLDRDNHEQPRVGRLASAPADRQVVDGAVPGVVSKAGGGNLKDERRIRKLTLLDLFRHFLCASSLSGLGREAIGPGSIEDPSNRLGILDRRGQVILERVPIGGRGGLHWGGQRRGGRRRRIAGLSA